MKIQAIISLILFLAGISICMHFQGCYTLVKHPDITYSRDRNSSSAQVSGSCVVEGVIHYIGGTSTWEIRHPGSYVLDNLFWLKNAPSVNFRYVLIESNTGRAYMNKYVRIKGAFLAPFSAFKSNEKAVGASIKISEIEILK
jgi:hypothetical protein